MVENFAWESPVVVKVRVSENVHPSNGSEVLQRIAAWFPVTVDFVTSAACADWDRKEHALCCTRTAFALQARCKMGASLLSIDRNHTIVVRKSLVRMTLDQNRLMKAGFHSKGFGRF